MKAKSHCIWALALLLLPLGACRHTQPTTASRLVGSDRDARGCISSAGYSWSNALHTCVRVWEVGVRVTHDQQDLFVIFSEDSLYAEITDGSAHERPLCRRVKGLQVWRNVKTNDQVLARDGYVSATLGDSVSYYSANCVHLFPETENGRDADGVAPAP